MDLKRTESEVGQLQTRLQQDAQLLKNLSETFKAHRASLSASTSPGTEKQDIHVLQSELQQMALTGKRVSERHKEDKILYEQLSRHCKELREHEEELFHEVTVKVQGRTVNDCFECQETSRTCIFSDESYQCTECQEPPRRRCSGSVNDDDTDRFKAALDNVDRHIDEILSRSIPNSHLYKSLKERLEQEENAVAASGEEVHSTSQAWTDHKHRVLRMHKTSEELREFRERSLIDDIAYQELLVRRRILVECHFELLKRGVAYYDDLEELAGYPQRRGYKMAEDMDHGEFREAVEWAAEHPGEWPTSSVPTPIELLMTVEEEDACDSGVEL